jgi:hypothetical protein
MRTISLLILPFLIFPLLAQEITDADDSASRIRAAIEEEKISVNFVDAPIGEAYRELNWNSHTYIVLSPEISDAQIRLTLKLDKVSRREAIAAFCERAGISWDIMHGAVYLYPRKKCALMPKRPIAKKQWERDVLNHLSRRTVSLEMIDTSFVDAIQYVGDMQRHVLTLDKKFGKRDEVLVFFCPVRDMRVDDAITWLCLLGRADWTLKKNNAGDGTIFIRSRR